MDFGAHADEWTNDTAFLNELAPVVIKALDWVIDVGTAGSPLPKRQCCTYDIIQFAGYDHTSFNSMMYLAALRAGERLAGHLGDPGLAVKCRSAYTAAVPFMNATLWNATHGYFRAWADSQQGAPPWVMADTLYGQVIANVLGLTDADGERWLVPPEMVASHLKVEAEFNPSPYGLTVVTTSGSPPTPKAPSKAGAEDRLVAPKHEHHRMNHNGGSCSEAVARSKYDSVWMGGAPDWAALQISLQDRGVGIEEALAMAKKELDHYRTDLRDQWNIHGLTANDGYGVDGQPWCTAHCTDRGHAPP